MAPVFISLFTRTLYAPMHLLPFLPEPQFISRDWGRKTIGVIGAAAGAATGFASVLRGGHLGAALGLVAGPAGSAVGGFAGAILGGLAAGAIGCEMGSSVGQTFDNHVLDNYRCCSCGHTFSWE